MHTKETLQKLEKSELLEIVKVNNNVVHMCSSHSQNEITQETLVDLALASQKTVRELVHRSGNIKAIRRELRRGVENYEYINNDKENGGCFQLKEHVYEAFDHVDAVADNLDRLNVVLAHERKSTLTGMVETTKRMLREFKAGLNDLDRPDAKKPCLTHMRNKLGDAQAALCASAEFTMKVRKALDDMDGFLSDED
jgi:hypothetical protein